MSTSTVLLAIIATLLVGVVSPRPSFLLVSRIRPRNPVPMASPRRLGWVSAASSS
jgi:hypothetical protein